MEAFMQKLFQAAKEAGLTEAEAFLVENESFEAACMEQEITQYSANATRGLGFRAMYGGKMGYASTEAFDEQAVDMLVQGALDSARLCEDSDEAFLHTGGDEVPAIDLFNPALEQVSPGEKLDFALMLEREAKGYDPRIEKVGDTTVFTGKTTVRIVNTHGMDRQYTRNDCGAFLQPVARDGESVSAGVKLCLARDFAKLDVKTLAEAAAKTAIAGLHAKAVPSGAYRVIFHNEVMTDLLGVFSSVFSAESAQKGMSLLKGKIGEMIAAPFVTLVDDPLMENGLASRPFDAEGVASQRHTLMENGQFLTFLHNLKTAHKDGVQSTGNAGKAGYAGAVQVSPSNLHFLPGEKSLAEMMAEAGEGLLITEVSGLHAGANAVSGDFSLLSKGFRIQKGEKQGPVEQITIAGNFFEMLKSIQALGNDLSFPRGGMGSPSVDVGMLSVGGV